MKNKERLGRFEISNLLLEEGKALYKLFSNFIILRCEHDYARAVFVYTAISELFDVISVGEMIPEYVITCQTKISKTDKTNYKFTAKRVVEAKND